MNKANKATTTVHFSKVDFDRLKIGSIVKKETTNGEGVKLTYYEPTLLYKYPQQGGRDEYYAFKYNGPLSFSKYGVTKRDINAFREEYQVLMTYPIQHDIDECKLNMSEEDYLKYREKEVSDFMQFHVKLREFVLRELHKYPRKLGYEPDDDDESNQNFDLEAAIKDKKIGKTVFIPSKLETEQGKKPSLFSRIKFYRLKDGKEVTCAFNCFAKDVNDKVVSISRNFNYFKDRSFWFIPLIDSSRLYFVKKDNVKFPICVTSTVVFRDCEIQDGDDQSELLNEYSGYVNAENLSVVDNNNNNNNNSSSEEQPKEQRKVDVKKDIDDISNKFGKYVNFDPDNDESPKIRGSDNLPVS